jgi:hypothetical protein
MKANAVRSDFARTLNDEPYQKKVVFNAATTDWARVLTDNGSASRAIVDRITISVLNKLSVRPDS